MVRIQLLVVVLLARCGDQKNKSIEWACTFIGQEWSGDIITVAV